MTTAPYSNLGIFEVDDSTICAEWNLGPGYPEIYMAQVLFQKIGPFFREKTERREVRFMFIGYVCFFYLGERNYNTQLAMF